MFDRRRPSINRRSFTAHHRRFETPDLTPTFGEFSKNAQLVERTKHGAVPEHEISLACVAVHPPKVRIVRSRVNSLVKPQ